MPAAFMSFEEAKDALGLGDKELHETISRGDLRAFRDQGTLKFRREDVEKLAATSGKPEPEREEDAGKTCEEMEEKVEQIKAVEKPQTSSAPTGRIGLAEIMPPAQRIDIAFTYMNHTLSPGSGVTALEEGDSHRTVKR